MIGPSRRAWRSYGRAGRPRRACQDGSVTRVPCPRARRRPARTRVRAGHRTRPADHLVRARVRLEPGRLRAPDRLLAAHGFVVIQATHMDPRRLNLAADDPRKPRLWRFRVADMKRVPRRPRRAGSSRPRPGRAAWTAVASPRPGTPSAARPPRSCWACASPTRAPESRKTCPPRGSPPASSWARPGRAATICRPSPPRTSPGCGKCPRRHPPSDGTTPIRARPAPVRRQPAGDAHAGEPRVAGRLAGR